jgi:serine/threonine-protein kinase
MATEARPTSSSSSRSSSAVDAGRFAPGTMLAGRYRVAGQLGKGGMGEVYRADDMTLAQPVALKFLPERLATSESMLARFHHEVRIARQVSHPNVCRVYDIGEVDGHRFLSMEYVDGEDLRSLLKRVGRLPGDRAIAIARQMCAGLAAAHDKGVLHRDLKPANVMIDGEGRARITDFGLAVIAEERSAGDVRSGTPAYMAPEQLAGREVSVASDIYSLGLVLFELFTGKAAYRAESMAELQRLQQGEPTSPSSLVQDLDPAVERVILRCLARHPAERPPSALAVAVALPGGDPLAAALAAGETPSPEMVAAAGETGGLRPAVAWGALAATVAGAAILVATFGKTQITGHAKLEKEPSVLVAEARGLLRSAGQEAPPADSAWGFRQNSPYLEHLEKLESQDRWDGLGAGPRSAILFFYRQGPRPLAPLDPVSHRMSPLDPPTDHPGMSIVWVDPAGRLVRLEAVPPERDAGGDPGEATDADWTALLEAAAIPGDSLVPVDPEWNPPVHSDRRVAWEGSAPGEPPLRVRIEGASYRGAPVFFRVRGDWERAAEEAEEPSSGGRRLVRAVVPVVFVSILLGAFLLARRNLRLGRSDRRGAFRIAAVFVPLHMLAWLQWAQHVPQADALASAFIGTLAVTLFEALMLYTFYLAVEPYVRRRWPDTIISWTRVLAGRFRDPLVGRDILFGVLLGVAMTVVQLMARLLPRWVGRAPDRPGGVDLATLLGGRFLFGESLDSVIHALIIPMLLLVFLLLLSTLVRKQWLAALGILVFFGLVGAATGGAIGALGATVWAAITLAALVRLGLLATVVLTAVSHVLELTVITTDLSAWYASGTILALTFLALVAGYGFHTALAGRPLFGADLLRD